MKYFIASKWSNMKAVQLLTENLTELGHNVFAYVDDRRNFVSATELTATPEALTKKENWQKDKTLRAMYEKNLVGLEDSEAVILLLPAGKNSHLSAGIAYGLSKRSILIGEPETVEPNYLLFDERHPSIEAFIASLHK